MRDLVLAVVRGEDAVRDLLAHREVAQLEQLDVSVIGVEAL